MIVAFDGNVFAGKTTLVNYLSVKAGYNSIPEHTFFVSKIKKVGKFSELNEHLRYLMVDSLRKKMMKKGVNLLDRSFVSLSAHIYALYISSGIDLREQHLAELELKLRQGNILVPNLYIYVSCGYKTTVKRFRNNILDYRNTPDLFVKSNYFSAVKKFNLLWQEKILNGLIIGQPINRGELLKVISRDFDDKNLLSPDSIVSLTNNIYFKS